MAKEIRVGIWIRVSSAQQAKTDSPKHHRLRAKAYAESRGWTVVTEYNLEGVKGDQVDSHPEFARMRKDIRSGRINVLVFSRLARLGRSLTTLIELAEEFKKCGAQLVSLGENLDTSTPMGRAFFFLAALFAEMEKENIAERIQDSVEIRAQLGKRLGQAVYGYQWNSARQLEINPEEADVRRLIYTLFIQIKDLHKTAEALNKLGYRRKKKPWVGNQIRALIEDTTAKGTRRVLWSKHGKTDTGKGKMIVLPESEWKWLPSPAIVSVEKWDEANRILADISREVNRSSQVRYAFAGLLYCSCGGKLYRDRKRRATSTAHPYRCHIKGCGNSIKSEELEEIVLNNISSFYCSEDSSRSAQLAEEVEQKTKALVNWQRSLAVAEREQAKLEDDYLELTASFFSRKLAEVEAKKEKARSELARTQGELDHLNQQLQAVDEMATEVTQIRLSWDNLSEERKRELGKVLIERIDISFEQVAVKLNALPNLFDRREQGVES